MLNDKDHAEKHLRSLHRELARLEQRRRHPPVHELIPPIQRGWKRSYVMTPATRLRPDALLLAAILDCLNTVQYFWRSNFQPTRRQRSRRRGSASVEQELMAIHWSAWERGPVPPGWRKYFRREFLPLKFLCEWPRLGRRQSPWSNRRDNQHDWGYAFRHPSWFELKVEKHWLTHYTEIEPGVAGRIAEIERWMDFHSGQARFQRLKGRSRWWLRHDEAAHRRCERQIEREMRAHLGLLGDEVADHIPSIQSRWGARGVGCFQPLCFQRNIITIFAAVRLEILRRRPPTRDQAVSPDTGTPGKGRRPWRRVGEPFPRRSLRGISVRTRCPGSVPPPPSDSPGSSKRAGSTPAGFLRKNTSECARHGGPVDSVRCSLCSRQ